MPQTHDVGRLYVHALNYPFPGAPWVDRADTVEIEPPFRRGKGFCVRYTPRRAFVVGRWGTETQEEADALREATSAVLMNVTLDEIMAWRPPLPDDEVDW